MPVRSMSTRTKRLDVSRWSELVVVVDVVGLSRATGVGIIKSNETCRRVTLPLLPISLSFLHHTFVHYDDYDY